MEDAPQYQPPLPERKPFQTPGILKYFAYAHLPVGVREISAGFHTLACRLAEEARAEHGYGRPVDMAELITALRKLLEAKDAAVRAFLEARR